MAAADALDLSELRQLVGRDDVLVDDDLRAGYEIDWTRRFHGSCAAVVRPGSTAEVAAVLRWCGERDVAVVPQGGNTGLVGGSVPPPTTAGRPVVIMSLRRLGSIGPVDEVAGQVTLGAGVTLAAAAAAVAGSGWEVPVDLGARETATIGGMVATNAGGTRVVRDGMMRRNVLGVEAVLADGSVVRRLGGLEKDNTGYDLAGLLCGSEGTLGVVTAVRLRLVPERTSRVAVLVACDGWDDAVDLSRDCRLGVEGVEALEALDEDTASVVSAQLGVSLPVGTPPVSVLVVWAGRGEPPEALAGAIGHRHHVVALDPVAQSRLWAPRDRATEAIATLGVPHKMDVTLPLSGIASFVRRVRRDLAATPSVRGVYVFGHVGDGNLHVNVMGPAPEDDHVDEAVLRLVAEHGGSISAEHGIGRLKRPWLHLSRTADERAAFAALKRALDPQGILNPGVLLG